MADKAPKSAIAPEDVADLTGFELMRGILEGRLPPASIAVTFGYRLHAVEKGRVAFRGAPGPGFLNPSGTVHGGWYGTLLDSALGCAVHTMLPAGSIYTTLEYKVNIIRPIPPGVEVEASATTSHAGRSTGIAEGRITGVEDGKLYATGSTTCIVMRAPTAG